MLKKLKNFISDKWQRFKKIIIIAIFGGVALAAGLGGIPQDIYNNLNVKVYTACNLQEARRASIESDFKTFKARNPDNSLRELNATERASIKTCEMAKRKTEFVGIYTSAQYGVKIEIIGDVKKIEINGQHGIELFAKAWRGTQQLGFGADGSVEIERFRIFNPPILVDDPNGTIIREWTDKETGVLRQRKLREDPIEAIRQTIGHNAKLVGKENTQIVIGKIGNTTTTVYPDPSTGATTVDGVVCHNEAAAGATWATVHDASSTNCFDATATTSGADYLKGGTTADQWSQIIRTIYLFDTSSITDTDIISSATFSVYSTATTINNAFSDSLSLVLSNPASNNALVAADYDTLGTTKQATDIAFSALTNSAFNDWTLNATGISNVSKTGITKLGLRGLADLNNTPPTWSSGGRQTFEHYMADQAGSPGTVNDPKLVVVHSGAAATGEEYQIIFGE